MTHDFQADIDTIAQIEAVPTILDVVCQITGMGFAAVARVTETRWVVCGVRDTIAFGLEPGGELVVETTICDEIRGSGQGVVIDHVAEDQAFRLHHTPAQYGFQSYISMPITLPDGSFFGTLCAIDPRPHKVSAPEVVGMFKLFADLIAFHIDVQRRMARSASDLMDERQSAMLREQFIAVLGHDLRNPLASLAAGTKMLSRTPLDEKAQGVLALMQGSVTRMAGLIDNVLDLARGRLGGGLPIRKGAAQPIRPVLEQVISELRAAYAERLIRADVSSVGDLACDPIRIGQLLSNLLSNAVAHGAEDGPIEVLARQADGVFELVVTNAGAPIPAAVMRDLFKPFFRAGARERHEGLGLGLYIASEIAHAHGGTLSVASDERETRFTFRMPA